MKILPDSDFLHLSSADLNANSHIMSMRIFRVQKITDLKFLDKEKTEFSHASLAICLISKKNNLGKYSDAHFRNLEKTSKLDPLSDF